MKAKEILDKKFNEFKNSGIEFNSENGLRWQLEAMQEYATECCKASLEKAAESGRLTVHYQKKKDRQVVEEEFIKTLRARMSGSNSLVILDKQSITDPENITLL